MKTGAGMPRTMRLTSQADNYVRGATVPQGLPLSGYDAMLGKTAATIATEDLCAYSRASLKRSNMVGDVVAKIPTSLVDGPATAAAATAAPAAASAASSVAGSPARATASAAAPAAAAGTGAAASPSTAAGAAAAAAAAGAPRSPYEGTPTVLPAMAAFIEIADKEPRRGIRGAMVQEFFSSGDPEGPFPGARSAQGEWMASTFYAHARPFGGSVSTLKPDQYSATGYKLTR